MVADTFSATLGVLFMGTGNDNNTWGTNCNDEVFQIFEDAIANILTSSITTGTLDLSGSPPPTGVNQARFWQLRFTGSLTSNVTVIFPNTTKEWFINTLVATYNGFSFNFKTPTGGSISLPPGWWRIWCDGNNVLNIWPAGYTNIYAPSISSGNGVESAGNPFYTWQADPTCGLYRHGTQDLRISCGATDIIQFLGPGGSPASLVNIATGVNFAIGGVIGGVVPTGAEMAFAGFLPPTGWYFEDGSAVSRTTDANLFNAITGTATGNTHNNTTVDGLSFNPVGIGLEGSFVEGTGISLGTTVLSVTSSSVTLSASAAGTNTGVSLRFLPFGQGDGSTTFNVPDRRGYVLAGRDNMNGTAAGRLTASTAQGILGTKLNATGGEQAHTQTQAEMPVHNHSASDSGHIHTDSGHTHPPSGGASEYLESSGAGTGLAVNQFGITLITPGATGIGFANIQQGFANITVGNAGSGGAHNNVQPTGITNWIIKR